MVLHRSVFDRLPGTGRWGTVLLLDGNLGIGGDLSPSRSGRPSCSADGVVVAELDPPGRRRHHGPPRGGGAPGPWCAGTGCPPSAGHRWPLAGLAVTDVGGRRPVVRGAGAGGR